MDELKENLRLFLCDDGLEAIGVYHWDDDGVRVVEIAPWSAGFQGARTTLRHIWYVIRHGHPYVDFVRFSQGQARELGEYLLSISKENPNG